MANLNRSIIGSIPVRVPPKEEREAISEAWSSLRGAAGRQRVILSALSNLRANLLNLLLSGEHEIPMSYDELMEA